MISQDTSAYGVDIKYAASQWQGREVRAKFIDLARALGRARRLGAAALRLSLPACRRGHPADGRAARCCPISTSRSSTPRPDVLKRMKRPAAQEKTLERIARWREICPDLTLRSTFIVGFPGETDADFELLLRLARRGRSSTASAASNTSRSTARAAERSRRAGAGRGEGRALAPLHAARSRRSRRGA